MKKPTISDIEAYKKEKGYKVDAESFIDHHTSKGWKIGSSPMKDWKAAVRTWERRSKKPTKEIKLSDMTIIELFDHRMSEIYGSKWKKIKSSESMWSNLVNSLSTDELKRGIQKCRIDSPEWPPSLFSFEEYCRGSVLHRTAAYKMYDKSRMLEVKKADPAVARRELDKIKETLR